MPVEMDDAVIEIAGGFGPLAGEVFRIGALDCNSSPENVDLLVRAPPAACRHG